MRGYLLLIVLLSLLLVSCSGPLVGKAVEVPDDYIVRWNFEDYDPGDSLAVDDEIDSEYDDFPLIVVSGSPQVVETENGNAIRFSGNDILKIEPGEDDEITLPRLEISTISFWIKPVGTGGTVFSNSEGSKGIRIQIGGNPLELPVLINNFGIGSTPTVNKLTLDKYSHVIVTIGDGTKIYVNGIEAAKFEDKPLGSPDKWKIGIGLNSNLHDLRIYTRELSEVEVKSIYQAGGPLKCYREFLEDDDICHPLPGEIQTLNPDNYNFGNEFKEASSKNYPELVKEEGYVSAYRIHKTNSGVNPPYNIMFFKYKENNYHVTLNSYNSYEGIASLSVYRTIGGNTPLGTIDFELDGTNPYISPVESLPIDIDSDSKTDFTVSAKISFDLEGNLDLVLVATPNLDFDEITSSEVILAVGENTFTHSGKQHSLYLGKSVDEGASGDEKISYLLSIDKSEDHKVKAKVKNQVSTIFEYFDDREVKGISINPIKELDDFYTFEIDRKPEGLDEGYEESFTKTDTLEIDDNVFKVCANDPPIPTVLTVCVKGDQVISLEDGIAKDLEEGSRLNYKDEDGDQKSITLENPVLFYFEQGTPKVGHAYNVLEVDEGDSEFATYFANNMVAGKRLAIRSTDEKLYFITHPKEDSLNLKSLKLMELNQEGSNTYSAEGDQKEVIFNLPLGKKIIVRLVAEPKTSYRISAKTEEAQSVNLLREMQASLSTYSKIRSSSSEVYLHPDDITTLQDKMHLKGTNINQELIYQTPHVLKFDNKNVLFYYNKFERQQEGNNPAKFIKYADLYLLYDLSQLGVTTTHPFTDEDFILPLSKGAKMALKVEDDVYYKLGLADENLNQGFSMQNLLLEDFSGATYSGTVTENNKFTFKDLPNGRSIELTFDTKMREVTFTAVSAQAAAITTFNPDEDYYAELPAKSEVEGIDNVLLVNGIEYKNCDTDSTAGFFESIVVCENGERVKYNMTEQIIRDGVYINYLGGTSKTVTFQKIIDLSSSKKFDWVELTDKLVEDKNPVIKFEDKYYELMGGSELSTFQLIDLESWTRFPIDNIDDSTEGAHEGAIIIGENILTLRQRLIDFDLNLILEKYRNKLVSAQGTELTNKGNFITDYGEEIIPYYATVIGSDKELVEVIILQDNEQLIQVRLPVGEMRNILLSNGDVVMIEVTEKNKVKISK